MKKLGELGVNLYIVILGQSLSGQLFVEQFIVQEVFVGVHCMCLGPLCMDEGDCYFHY
jgi:hypothetical protein